MDKNKYLSIFDPLILNPETRKIYGQKEFFNVGYWPSDTQNQESACFNLMEKLLSFIPEKKGTILDVGCGLGASTSHLLEYYSPSDVVGINISAKQLERSIVNAPGCKFICMDAVQMDFEDNLFDNIICVEAALYFDTREKFLQEAWRLLKPGGHLILCDFIFEAREYFGDGMVLIPEGNIVKNMEDYRNLYQKAGFDILEFLEATDDCWLKHFRVLKSVLSEEFEAGKVDEEVYQTNVVAIDRLLSSPLYIAYLLVSATKSVK